MAAGPSDRRDGPLPVGQRIIVLLDDSPESMRALETAAGLARHHRGALLGLFVEERDLVRSAGFAFAGEIGATSGGLRQRPAEGVRGEIRRRVRLLRQALERIARARGIEHELVVRRGRVVEEILSFSAPDDLLIVGRVGWSQRLGRTFGSVPLALARSAPGAVLIWTASRPVPGGRIAVLAENGSTLEPVLAVAHERATLHQCGISVLLPPGLAPKQIESVRHQANTALDPAEVPHDIRVLTAANPASLIHALGQARAIELILSRRGQLLNDPEAARLLERIRLPVCVAP
ncbi:universal stress protein [Wenzhouxiangella sp. AB-CW3]|uniref:universal stress protein n=1 Tax=Wenzhouxiangella sp. AB-CW3 TaxID=2771012 RepID=UPI00168B0ECC|nr:universal stress protein [Wenzhouxiangella sp. AB-CW3]QOC23114.1 universal stress protein [Wenzhouxiangella sp. AB-CW3]